MSFGLYLDFYNLASNGTKVFNGEASEFGNVAKACLDNAIISFDDNKICATLFIRKTYLTKE